MLSIGLLVQEKIADSVTVPLERSLLSFLNHTHFYNMVVCLLDGWQGGELNAIPVVFMKVPKLRKPKPSHIDWSSVLKLE